MPAKRLTRAERAARTRKLLMAAASRVCAKHGLERASIDEVAEEAGFTKGAFYANFRSKEELFLAMLDERFSEQLRKLDRTLSDEGELPDQVRAAASNFAHDLSDDPEWVRLYFQFAAHAARHEDFRAELVTRERALRARMADIIERRTERLPFPAPFPPDLVARMADAMIDGFAMHQLLDPDDYPDDLHATMWTVFAAGLKALAVEGAEAAAPAASSAG
jgi:AcrR family transcriptional regulator